MKGDMLNSSRQEFKLKIKQTERFILYKVSGFSAHPLRFDLINLDGKKIRSVDLLYGHEFVIPIKGVAKGEYLFAINSTSGLLQTGVINI
ncbi:MAG: hypothetical protein WEC59_01750 [Salibacteraceae bacterium]